MNRTKKLSFSLFYSKLSRITWVSLGLMAAIFLGSVSVLLYQQHQANSIQIEAELTDAINSQEQYFAQELYLGSEQAISIRIDSILKEWEARHKGVQACLSVSSELLSGSAKTVKKCTLAEGNIPTYSHANEDQIMVNGQVVARITHAVLRPAGWLDLFPPSLIVALLTAALSAALIHRFLVERLRESILNPLFAAAAREQRNAAIAETTQMIAHDLKKPFAMMKMTLAELSEIDDARAFRAIRDQVAPEIQRTIHSVDNMLKDIIEIGTDAPLETEVTSPTVLVRNAVFDVLHLYPGSNIRIHYGFGHTNKLDVESEKAARVFSNLIENAVHALNMRGTMRIETRQVPQSDGTQIEFCIANNGPVIPPQDIEHVFDAFFTKKKGGSGLGLAISKKIVESHRGKVWCESSETEGTRFYFTLPAAVECLDDTDARGLPRHSTDVAGTSPREVDAKAQEVS